MNFFDYNVFNLKNKIAYENSEFNVDKGFTIKEKTTIQIEQVAKPIEKISLKNKDFKYYVYIFQLVDRYERILYVGSTHKCSSRAKQHINNLLNDKHHNKKLQNKFNNMSNVRFEYSLYKGTNIKSELIELEHDSLIDIASIYHNKIDNEGRKITVVYSS